MKKILIVFLVIFLVIAGIIFCRNAIIKSIIKNSVIKSSGLNIQIGSIDTGLIKPVIYLKGLKVSNPKEFTDSLMIDLPEAYIKYDVWPFLFKKRIHLTELRINLRELVIERNKSNKLNVDYIKPQGSQASQAQVSPGQVNQQKPRTPQIPEFYIDLLELKLGKVTYKDYNFEPVNTQVFVADINESYQNISNIDQLTQLILASSLKHLQIYGVRDFLKASINSTIGNTDSETADKMSKKLDKAFDKLGKFLQTQNNSDTK